MLFKVVQEKIIREMHKKSMDITIMEQTIQVFGFEDDLGMFVK